jgi:2-dehydro-3-deoxyphosphogluconate aldolase/(4S)-4-hydroxy-2-oxoglutarate aldolase
MADSPLIATLRRIGVVAVIRGKSADEAVAMGRALIAGGVMGIEITYSTPDCAAAIARMVKEAPSEAAVGVGTVRTIAELEAAHAAGATYAVSPHTDLALIARARALGIPMLPGALTPTEVVTAWNAGASCIKLFPGSVVGVDYVKALRGPLPDIPLMVTGGVTVDNLPEWFAAGVVAVGMGGDLAKGDPATITAAAKRTMERFRGIAAGPAAKAR